MPRLFITGGRQRPTAFRRKAEWHCYDQARLVELDTEAGHAQVRLRYQSPAARCPPEMPSHVFKAGSWDGPHVLVCTQTEVLWVDPDTWTVARRASHKWMNDVHHAARIGGRVHVVSTGLDAVLVLDETGAVVETVGALGTDPFLRFDPARDWRQVPTTKPHGAHPNYVFGQGGRTWITRFEQGDCLEPQTGRTLPLSSTRIHDGVVDRGRVWFTSVDGHVIEADPNSGRVLATHDLTRFADDDRPLGWCRGLFRQKGITFVGFTKVRSTRFKENLSWLRGPLNRPDARATRVAAYDLAAGEKRGEWALDHLGFDAVFSILGAQG